MGAIADGVRDATNDDHLRADRLNDLLSAIDDVASIKLTDPDTTVGECVLRTKSASSIKLRHGDRDYITINIPTPPVDMPYIVTVHTGTLPLWEEQKPCDLNWALRYLGMALYRMGVRQSDLKQQREGTEDE